MAVVLGEMRLKANRPKELAEDIFDEGIERLLYHKFLHLHVDFVVNVAGVRLGSWSRNIAITMDGRPVHTIPSYC